MTFTIGDDVVTLNEILEEIHALRGNDRITINDKNYNFFVWGDNGDDTIFGGGGRDQIRGGDDDDEIHGNASSDTIAGDRGDDLIYGGKEGDRLFGGDLSGIVATSIDPSGTTLERDYVDGTNIARPSGNDTIYGGDDPDHIIGFDGADELYGGVNVDRIWGGADNDTIFGDEQKDALYGGENDDFLYGGHGDDALFDDHGRNALFGGIGEDVFTSTGGDNAYYGGEGRDQFMAGSGDDTIYADAEDLSPGLRDPVVIAAGLGRDLLTFELSAEAIQINMGRFNQFERIIGSAFDDTIQADVMEEASGGAGNDEILSITQGQILDGGAGVDVLRYRESDAGVRVYLDPLAEGPGGPARGGHAEGDVISGFENLVASDHADDLRGDAGANSLIGRLGDDSLRGRDGDDDLRGNGDDDYLEGGAGADTIDGGMGVDTASYRDSAMGVTVDLAAKTASGGDAAGDMLIAIENLTGSYKDDRLTGNAGDNRLNGEFGNDVLEGGAGADTLMGGVGDDTLTGGADADVFLFNAEWHKGDDVIVDFEEGLDQIQILGEAEVELTQQDWGTEVLIQGAFEATLTVKGAWEVDLVFLG